MRINLRNPQFHKRTDQISLRSESRHGLGLEEKSPVYQYKRIVNSRGGKADKKEGRRLEKLNRKKRIWSVKLNIIDIDYLGKRTWRSIDAGGKIKQILLRALGCAYNYTNTHTAHRCGISSA